MPNDARRRYNRMRRARSDLRKFAHLAVFLAPGICASQSSVNPAGDEQRMRIERHAEKKYLVKLETTQHKKYCKAKVSVQYFQRDTMASVAGRIENGDCGPSGGEYTIAIRIRDEAGQTENIEYEERWQRADDQPVIFSKDYYIGENVDLVRVRTRKLQCVCDEISADDEDESPANQGEDQ